MNETPYLRAVAYQATWEPARRRYRKHTGSLGDSETTALAWGKPVMEQLRLIDGFYAEERHHSRIARTLLTKARRTSDPMDALDLRKQALQALDQGYQARLRAGTVEHYMKPPIVSTPSKRRYRTGGRPAVLPGTGHGNR